MVGIFGAPYLVPQDTRGSNVVAIETDQQNPQNVIITSKDHIKLYETDGSIIHKTWLCKSLQSPSSGCLNDASGQFYCPVSKSKLLQWTAEVDDLDNIKPINLGSKIHKLHPYNGSVFVVYCSGYVEEVATAIKTANKEDNTLQVLPEGEDIKEVLIADDTVILATTKEHSAVPDRLHLFPLRSPQDVSSYTVSRPSLTLTGLGLTSRCTVITLWSNGDLCSGVVCSAQGSQLEDELQRLRVVGSCSQVLECSKPARILQATTRHVAIMGQDVTKDGGRVSVWDLDLLLEVGGRHLKLYQRGLRCWGGGRRVLLQERDDITVLPLVALPPRGLQQLLLAPPRIAIEDDKVVLSRTTNSRGYTDSIPCSGLLSRTEAANNASNQSENLHHSKSVDNKKKLSKKTKHTDIDTLIEHYSMEKLDDSLCCEVLINEAKKQSSLKLVFEILTRFSFLCEQRMVELLAMILDADDNSFVGLEKFCKRGSKKRPLSNGHVNSGTLLNGHLKQIHRTNKDDATQHFTGPRGVLVDMVLTRSFTEALLCSEMRKLPFRHAIQLMHYLRQLTLSKSSGVTSVSSSTAAGWLGAISAAHSQVIVIDQLFDDSTANRPYKLMGKVQSHTENLEHTSAITSLMDIGEADDIDQDPAGDGLYYIETIKLPIL